MQHFDVLILSGRRPEAYRRDLLGKSVLARMADSLRAVTDGAVCWDGENAPADAALDARPKNLVRDTLRIYQPCPLVAPATWDSVSGKLWAGETLLADRGGEESARCPEGEGILAASAAGFTAALTALRRAVSSRLLESGVLLWDPEGAFIAPEVSIAPGTEVLPGCILTGKTSIGPDCRIGPGATLENASVGANVTVNQSQVLDSSIGDGTAVGPFAYIRPGTVIGKNCRVGDFVELKKASIGDGTKIAHLTYVGDADLGKKINIGCGTVFANYDGKNKYRIRVGDNVFIGCNTNLIAPVTVAEDVYIATGTTVAEDVTEPGSLVIGRPRQSVKPGWVKKRKEAGKL